MLNCLRFLPVFCCTSVVLEQVSQLEVLTCNADAVFYYAVIPWKVRLMKWWFSTSRLFIFSDVMCYLSSDMLKYFLERTTDRLDNCIINMYYRNKVTTFFILNIDKILSLSWDNEHGRQNRVRKQGFHFDYSEDGSHLKTLWSRVPSLIQFCSFLLPKVRIWRVGIVIYHTGPGAEVLQFISLCSSYPKCCPSYHSIKLSI